MAAAFRGGSPPSRMRGAVVALSPWPPALSASRRAGPRRRGPSGEYGTRAGRFGDHLLAVTSSADTPYKDAMRRTRTTIRAPARSPRRSRPGRDVRRGAADGLSEARIPLARAARGDRVRRERAPFGGSARIPLEPGPSAAAPIASARAPVVYSTQGLPSLAACAHPRAILDRERRGIRDRFAALALAAPGARCERRPIAWMWPGGCLAPADTPRR